MLNAYENLAYTEMTFWQKKMLRDPSFLNHLSRKTQTKINTWIPEKVHQAITLAIKQMIRAVLFGAKYATSSPLTGVNLQVREEADQKKIDLYKNSAAVEGGITGVGGILPGLEKLSAGIQGLY